MRALISKVLTGSMLAGAAAEIARDRPVLKTREQMIAELETRIADQRQNGGDMMTLGTPDLLDVAMLSYLKDSIA